MTEHIEQSAADCRQGIGLSELQRKVVANGMTARAGLLILAFVALAVYLVVKVLGYLSPALMPVIVGAFMAMICKPLYNVFLRVMPKGRNQSAWALIAMLVLIVTPLAVVLWLSGSFLVGRMADFLSDAPNQARALVRWVNDTFPDLQVNADRLGIPYARWLTLIRAKVWSMGTDVWNWLSSLFNGLLSLVFFAYFIMRPDVKGRRIADELPFLSDDGRAFVAEQIDAFVDIVVCFFRRQIPICLVEGLLYGVAFMALRLPCGFLLGFFLGVMNLVPIPGWIVVLPIAAPLAYWGDGGSIERVISVFAVCWGGWALDLWITPKIQGEKTGLGYAGVIFSFLFWGVVFRSMIGVFLAIPLSAFCVVFWRAVKTRFFRRSGGEDAVAETCRDMV